MYEKPYIQVYFKELLKLFKCLASSDMHTVSGLLNPLFKALHQERKRRKEIILTRLVWALTRGDREVINFTRSHVKNNFKLTNLIKISRIEGYNGK